MASSVNSKKSYIHQLTQEYHPDNSGIFTIMKYKHHHVLYLTAAPGA